MEITYDEFLSVAQQIDSTDEESKELATQLILNLSWDKNSIAILLLLSLAKAGVGTNVNIFKLYRLITNSDEKKMYEYTLSKSLIDQLRNLKIGIKELTIVLE